MYRYTYETTQMPHIKYITEYIKLVGYVSHSTKINFLAMVVLL